MPRPAISLPQLEDKHFTLPVEELARCVRDARRRTLALVGDLAELELEVPYCDVLNPLRWELGHVAFFYEANLLRLLGHREPILAGGDDLYNSFEVDHDDRWGLDLPSREEVLGALGQVEEAVLEHLKASPPGPVETYLSLLSVLHEDMHAEAFTYMRQTLEYSAPRLPAAEAPRHGAWPGDVEVPGGVFEIGARPEAPFVFDNEKWAHEVELQPFAIARAPVTNAEFAGLVEDRGYLRRDLWSVSGWVWRCKAGALKPLHWQRSQTGWLRRHFDRFVPLEDDAPAAHVSWYEAEAYCNWAGRRLPTEAEWERAASWEPSTGRKRRFPWGEEPPRKAQANLDAAYDGYADVAAFAEGDSACGCRQMAGNVWEWTSSPFYPYPGYVVDFPYREYSAPWFGYPRVLKGGSWATRSRLAYNTYRNFFLPGRRDVFTGFRTCAL